MSELRRSVLSLRAQLALSEELEGVEAVGSLACLRGPWPSRVPGDPAAGKTRCSRTLGKALQSKKYNRKRRDMSLSAAHPVDCQCARIRPRHIIRVGEVSAPQLPHQDQLPGSKRQQRHETLSRPTSATAPRALLPNPPPSNALKACSATTSSFSASQTS